MSRIIHVFNSPSWTGLVANLLLVWTAIAVSTLGPSLLGATIGGGSAGPKDAPWTPPGSFIGLVWVCLYTLIGLSLWTLNRVAAENLGALKPPIYVLLLILVTWTFYAFSETSRWPGLIGNLLVFAAAFYCMWRLWPYSRGAALMIAPVAVWITIATATILDGARRYGW